MNKVVPLKIHRLSLSPDHTSIINEDLSSVELKNCNVFDFVHAMPQQNYNNNNNKRLSKQSKGKKRTKQSLNRFHKMELNSTFYMIFFSPAYRICVYTEREPPIFIWHATSFGFQVHGTYNKRNWVNKETQNKIKCRWI